MPTLPGVVLGLLSVVAGLAWILSIVNVVVAGFVIPPLIGGIPLIVVGGLTIWRL